MKFFVIFVALLGVNSAIAGTLQDDFQDFLNVIPVAHIRRIASKQLESDEAFRSAVAYLQGDEWKQIVSNAHKQNEVQKLLSFVSEAGLDLQVVFAALGNLLSGEEIHITGDVAPDMTYFLRKAYVVVPWRYLRVLWSDKQSSSEAFRRFFNLVSSDKAYYLVEGARTVDEVKIIESRLLEMGLNVRFIMDKMYSLLGWH